MRTDARIDRMNISRRTLMGGAVMLGGLATARAASAETVTLGLNGGPAQRAVSTAFPQKGAMILQRTRPPLLETPFEVFDQGVFTPNERFFVRWHWAVKPEQIDLATFRVVVRGHVSQAQRDCGVAAVETSVDAGATWQAATLGRDEGTHSFRQRTADATAPSHGALTPLVRCTNTRQVVQPMEPNWNGGGFMRNVIERVALQVG